MDWAAHVGELNATVMAAFGVDTTYTPTGGAALAIRGAFDNEYVRVDTGEAAVSSSGPAVWYQVADLPAGYDEDTPTIEVNGATYQPHAVEPDGQGGVWLILHRAS